jgi:hypothetical protein
MAAPGAKYGLYAGRARNARLGLIGGRGKLRIVVGSVLSNAGRLALSFTGKASSQQSHRPNPDSREWPLQNNSNKGGYDACLFPHTYAEQRFVDNSPRRSNRSRCYLNQRTWSFISVPRCERGKPSSAHADDLGSSDLRGIHSTLAIVLKNCSISNPIISAETSERPNTSIVPPPYVPPIPLEVWTAFGAVATGGLLTLVLYILNMWRK